MALVAAFANELGRPLIVTSPVTLLYEQLAPLPLQLTPLNPAGNIAEYVTPAAVAGPLLPKVIATLMLLPAAAVAGAVSVVVTSAITAVDVSCAMLFAGCGSVVPAGG